MCISLCIFDALFMQADINTYRVLGMFIAAINAAILLVDRDRQ